MNSASAPEAIGSVCRGCGANRLRRLWPSRDYLTGDRFEVLECTRCGLRQTYPVPDADAQEVYYGKLYYGKGGQRFVGLLEEIERWVRRSRSHLVLGLHPERGTLLDVGCGRAAMLTELARRGWKCVGTERPSGRAGASPPPGVAILFQDLASCDFPGEGFDVVTLWHVLEHLGDPVETLAEIRRILAPGGFLVLEVPNGSSWQSAIGRGSWFHLDVPRHLFHYTRPWLKRSLEEAGFIPLRTGTWSLEQGPYGMVQTLLNLAARQPNWLYARLRRAPRLTGPGFGRVANGWAAFATLVLFLPLAAIGTLLEAAAAAIGRGGVLNIVARRI